MSNVQILIGDCRDILKTIPSKSVKLVVTSPPYNIGKPYGKYKDKIPLNEWEELIDEVTKEIYRVLTDDGVLWLNLGDCWAGSNQGAGTKNPTAKQASNHGTNYIFCQECQWQ